MKSTTIPCKALTLSVVLTLKSLAAATLWWRALAVTTRLLVVALHIAR